MESIALGTLKNSPYIFSTPMVLVCEGDDVIRKLLIRYIEHATHWEVHGAANGHLAQQFLAVKSYDMVVSSLFLDFKNGSELLYHIRRELHSDIPVIIMSSDPAEDTAIRAFEMGADDVVNKPMNMKELVARMKYQMNKYKSTEMTWKALG